MPHVPARSQDIIGTAPLRDAIVFKAHETYPLDGIDLNNLALLALRLTHAEPLDAIERETWGDILRYMLADAQRSGTL